MSGLEVVGLVLGVLPIAVKTLQTYKKALSSYKNAVGFIQALKTDLINEHCILRCTCETLIQGIAPIDKIDLMLKDPFGPEWKQEQFNRALCLRLGQSYSSVESGIQELKNLLEELTTKLGLGSDLKSSLLTKEDILLEIKKKTAFTLKEDDYKTVLAKIKSANFRLNMIVGLNIGLEPRRRHRSQWRFTQLLRDLSRGLFNALDGATAACCTRPHDACLKLSPRPLEMDPGSFEDQVAKDLDFQLSLGLYRDGSMSAGSLTEQSRIYNLEIRIVDFGSRNADEHLPKTLNLRSSPKNPTEHSSQLNGTLTTAKGTSEGRKKRKFQPLLGHIFRSMTRKGKAIKALARGSLDLIVEPNPKVVGCLKTSTPNPVLGLCQLIRMQEKSPSAEQGRLFYGHIVDREDPERRFGLYAPTPLMSENQHKFQAPPILRWQPSHFPSILTLRQLLDRIYNARFQKGSNEPLIWLEFQDQLQLAVTIAVNILHLYSSPWLPKVITLDDILFRLEDEASSSNFPSGFPYRPFIKKSIPFSASAAMPETFGCMPRSRKRETTVFSFGLLLIQIMLGRVINELDMKPTSNGQGAATPGAEQSVSNTTNNNFTTMSMDDYLEKHKLGKGYEGAVLAEAGPEYTSAVTRCLESFINIEGLQSEKFCQEFYVDVISMLQEALNRSMVL